MSDIEIIALCIVITMICLTIVVSITIYNFVKAFKLIRKDMKEEREKRELEVLKELE